MRSFKPYYNWNTFNTSAQGVAYIKVYVGVLNLIITGIPSIPKDSYKKLLSRSIVLNLIITGIPSIHEYGISKLFHQHFHFKPYYNWNTFNTVFASFLTPHSICFKPYYNWNTFNT